MLDKIHITKPTLSDCIKFCYIFAPVILALIFLCSIAAPAPLSDAWFIFQHAEKILETGTFPTQDWMTCHDGMPIIIANWITAILYYGIYSAGGRIACAVFVAAAFFGLGYASYKSALSISKGNAFAASMIAVTATLGMLGFHEMRPWIMSSAIVFAELFFLYRYADSGKTAYLASIPLAALLMVNMHTAMLPFVFVFALPFVFGKIPVFTKKFIQGEYKSLPVLCACLIAIVVSLVNPYGLDGALYSVHSFNTSINSLNIQEMLPISYGNSPDVFFAVVFLAIFFCVKVFSKKRVRLCDFMLFSGAIILAFMYGRDLFISSIAIVFPLAYAFRLEKPFSRPKTDPSEKKLNIMAVGCMMIIACVIVVNGMTNVFYPANGSGAVSAIKADSDYKPEDAVYTGFNTGQYAEYEGLKAYIDGRAEVFTEAMNHQKDYVSEYVAARSGKIYYRDFLNEYNFSYVITDATEPFYILLAHDSDYSMIYEGTDVDGYDLLSDKSNATVYRVYKKIS